MLNIMKIPLLFQHDPVDRKPLLSLSNVLFLSLSYYSETPEIEKFKTKVKDIEDTLSSLAVP